MGQGGTEGPTEEEEKGRTLAFASPLPPPPPSARARLVLRRSRERAGPRSEGAHLSTREARRDVEGASSAAAPSLSSVVPVPGRFFYRRTKRNGGS
jgi:hypothetical protein